MKNIRKFISPDNSQVLTIVAQTGKSGINVKASMKQAGKGVPKAVTGGRAKPTSEQEAIDLVAKMANDATKLGWVPVAVSVKNAFTEIPAPSKNAPLGSNAPIAAKNANKPVAHSTPKK